MTPPVNRPLSDALAERKDAHIVLAQKSQTSSHQVDERFYYEPMFFSHPTAFEKSPTTFLKFDFDYPIWISSMTGGTDHARTINENLAKLTAKYKLGMGLGSCRALLHSDERLHEFSFKSLMGNQPLFANLGLAQVEELVLANQTHKIHEMVKKLEADGLIIHLNPLQEWFQPEGDRYRQSPMVTIERFLEKNTYPVIVKEVGQGLGPRSLKALMEMPIAGVEFGAFGGTNFSLLESLRAKEDTSKAPFIQVGHTALEMVSFLNEMNTSKKEFIISGGIKNVLDGFELRQKLKAPSVMGMAQAFLAPALKSFDDLEQYFLSQREALLTAQKLLDVKGEA